MEITALKWLWHLLCADRQPKVVSDLRPGELLNQRIVFGDNWSREVYIVTQIIPASDPVIRICPWDPEDGEYAYCLNYFYSQIVRWELA